MGLLDFANVMAGGASSFIQERQQLQQAQMQRQLQQLQMQKLTQEITPQAVDFQKVGAAYQAFRSGLIPKSDYSKVVGKAFDNAQTPAQAQALAGHVNRAVSQQQGPGVFAEDQGVEGAGAGALPGDPPSAPQAQAPAPLPSSYTMNPTEREYLGHMITSGLADEKMQNYLAAIGARGDNAKSIQQLKDETAKAIAQIRATQSGKNAHLHYGNSAALTPEEKFARDFVLQKAKQKGAAVSNIMAGPGAGEKIDQIYAGSGDDYKSAIEIYRSMNAGAAPSAAPAKIQVKRKSDGAMGTILEKDFNPAVYEKAQ